jgi:hypothetical protein
MMGGFVVGYKIVDANFDIYYEYNESELDKAKSKLSYMNLMAKTK